MAIFIAALAFFGALGAVLFVITNAQKVDAGLAHFGNALRKDIGATRREINADMASINERLDLLMIKFNRLDEAGGKATEEIIAGKMEIASLRGDLTELSDCIPSRLKLASSRPQQDINAN